MSAPTSAPMSVPTPAPAPAPSLEALLAANRAPGLRLVAGTIVGLLALFVVWAWFAQLDEVSVAPGEVVPQDRIKVVQHLEGGLITAIFVREGDTVREGDPLLQLDLATAGVNREELQVRLDSLFISRARLLAEAETRPLDFPPVEAARRPGIVAAELDSYTARQEELATMQRVLTQQVNQREAEIREIEARTNAITSTLRLLRERLRLSANLLRDSLTPRMEHLQLQSEVEGLEGELRTLEAALPRVHAALEEGRERLAESSARFRREARDQLREVETSIARTQELMQEATNQQLRTEIRSPTDGIVKNMRHNTIGGVVAGGEAILDIVPSRDNLIIEARLAPTDRGYVREGQSATIKISTFDYARYGGLEGTVLLVAPDSTVPDNAPPYFRVIVQPERYWLGETEDDYVITPGMEATVDIHTGTRSVLDFLIRPVLKLRHEAFRER